MRILIADDDRIPLNLLRFQLEQLGHSVLVAENGVQAWNLFQNNDCQVVITDWEMPGLTGIELLRRIRSADRAGYVYVILLTSKSKHEALVTGLITGADTFLTKPVNLDELQARLRPSQRIIELEQRLAERQREVELRNRQLSQANAKMKRNLELAAKIQQAFLPQRQTEIPGVRFAWHFSPCEELAGDMLNVLPLDQEHVGMYVLDVSGHGVPAALLAVSICRSLSCHQDDSSVLWRRAGESGDYEPLSPSAVVRSLNARVLGQSQTEQFFTLFYGILNHRTGEFRYAVAGHPAPVLLSADDEVTLLPGSGFPVGIIETDFEEERLVLAPGDRLLFYSDGVTESMNSAGELFGDDRLLETLRDAAPDSTLEALLAAALDDSAAWRGEAPIQDDLSLLALEYAPQPSSVPGPVTAPAKCSSVVPVTTLSAGAGWRS